jgi:signal transduction histidine kinase
MGMLWRTLLVAAFAMSINCPARSEDQPPSSAEAKHIEALVKKAADVVDAKGKPALSEFREKGSEWFSGDLYVFAYAPDGTVLLNPAFPAREGRSYHGEKDKKGKAFHDDIMQVAREKGSGWVDYWLPKPGQTEPSHKWSYVKAVKAEGVALVGAGFFPD